MDSVLVLSELPWVRWVVGLVVVSLVGGAVAGGLVVALTRGWDEFLNGLPIGFVERLFFTLGVAFALPGIVTAMIAWIAAKMAAGWGSESGTPKTYRIGALAGGLSSMVFAMLGGLVAAGRIRL
jgi:hypothetical protein